MPVRLFNTFATLKKANTKKLIIVTLVIPTPILKFDDFLAKPISIDKMEKILRKYLRRELLVPKNSAGAKQI